MSDKTRADAPADVTIPRAVLTTLLIEMAAALAGDSNDAEHDALFDARQTIAGWLGDPVRLFEKDDDA